MKVNAEQHTLLGFLVSAGVLITGLVIGGWNGGFLLGLPLGLPFTVAGVLGIVMIGLVDTGIVNLGG